MGPCTIMRYSPTQVTRWSLNVPLMIWWRRSEHKSSWMSAWGNSAVNGCKWLWLDTEKDTDHGAYKVANSTELVPECFETVLLKQCLCKKEWTTSSWSVKVICRSCTPVKHAFELKGSKGTRRNRFTWDTNPEQCTLIVLAPDNQQCTAQGHR